MLPTRYEAAAMSYLIEEYLDYLRTGQDAAIPDIPPRRPLREASVKAAADVLHHIHRDLPFGLAYAATEQIKAWLAHVGWSAWTRYAYSKHIRGFYRWACLTGRLDGDPSIALPRPKAPKSRARPCKDEQLARALSAPEPVRTAVLLAAYEGMRIGEIARCERDHISEDLVDVPEGKGGQPGVIPTHPLVWSVVRHRNHGRLVAGRRGQPITSHWLSIKVRIAFDRLGMPKLTLHMLRHWYGTGVQREYRDLRVTQECLRHRSVQSTEIYTAVTDAQKLEAVTLLPVVEPEPDGNRLGPTAEAA